MKTEVVNTIKLLIYKEAPQLLEKLNFEDDNVFLEPLLFAYFNGKKTNLFSSCILQELMQGYCITKEKISLNHAYNENNIAYIPMLGYYRKGEKNPFEPIRIIDGTTIEVLLDIPKLLKYIVDPNDKIKKDKLLFEKNICFLTNALAYIKNSSSNHYTLIESHCRKILLFNTNPEISNSFATINANGIAFINVYQEDYDEVFFVEDIAHQTGHVILYTLLFNKKKVFKIDETQLIEPIIKQKDHRDIHILFHSLYTYYTIFQCLDNCIVNNLFSEKQKKEAIARIGFNLKKCSHDLYIYECLITHFSGIDYMLTEIGASIYTDVKNKFIEIDDKWGDFVQPYSYSNQPYNFTYKYFNEINT